MPVNVLVGLQWGDEGKGKIIDVLTKNVDIVARYQGGNNAGHTVEVEDEKYVLHLLPSGILRPSTMNVIGNGLVVDIVGLYEEINDLKKRGIDCKDRLLISNRVNISFKYHKQMDAMSERNLGENSIGTTQKGIGPTYSDKINRKGLRMSDILNVESFFEKLKYNIDEYNEIFSAHAVDTVDFEEEKAILTPIIKELTPMIIDTALYLNKAVKENKNILFEGAQGMWLDVDFGTYPFVTSSNTTIGGVCSGSGIPPQSIDSAIGIAKAYTTRVGEGPFMTELNDELGEQMRKVGNEFGATTGRPRRCGWFDAVATRYSAMLNGIDSFAVMKLDVLSNINPIKICTAYEYNGKRYDEIPKDLSLLEKVTPIYEEHSGWSEDLTQLRSWDELPENAKKYIARMEELVKTKASIISVGPGRAQTFERS